MSICNSATEIRGGLASRMLPPPRSPIIGHWKNSISCGNRHWSLIRHNRFIISNRTSWAGVHASHLPERGVLRRNITLEVSRWGILALTTLNIHCSPVQSTVPGEMQVLEDNWWVDPAGSLGRTAYTSTARLRKWSGATEWKKRCSFFERVFRCETDAASLKLVFIQFQSRYHALFCFYSRNRIIRKQLQLNPTSLCPGVLPSPRGHLWLSCLHLKASLYPVPIEV